MMVYGPTARIGRNAAEDRAATRARLEKLAWLLDGALVVPGTEIRVGLDALIGLVPGVGDVVAAALSSYLIFEARRLGAPKHVILRMVWNLGLDTVLGAVPVVGDVFDVAWRANLKNLRLLEDYLDRTDGRR